MRASARLVAELVEGRTRCTTLQSQPPLTFRQNRSGLMWVATAAGPIGGDDLHLAVRLGPAAALDVASAGATIVLPGVGAARSRLRIDVVLGPRSCLVWHPEPTVLATGADHVALTSIQIAADASLVWVDELVLGRQAEAPGRLVSRLAVEIDERVALRTGLTIGAPGWDGPAVTAGHRAHAQVVLAGDAASRWRAGRDAAITGVGWTSAELAGGVELVTIAGREPRPLRAAVAAVTAIATQRPAATAVVG